MMTEPRLTNDPRIDETTPATQGRHAWRVVDIVVAAVLGVAVGLIFFAWNAIGYPWFKALDGLTPGLGGLVAGIWFLGGPLGMLIIRKPGAAVFVELIGATVSALIGNAWGVSTLYSGIAQGLGAELIFLFFAYRSYKLPVALLAGAGAGLGAWTLELFTSGNLQMGEVFLVIYLVCTVISGIVLAGFLGWLLTRSLAATGVLNRFASGRDAAGGARQ